MMEVFLSSLAGGVIGAALTYFGVRLQSEIDLKRIARACLIEMESLSDDELVADETFYRPLLAQWKASGDIANKELLAQIFSEGPKDHFPVYYANVGELGRFSEQVSTPLIRYHRLRSGLMATAARVLLAEDLEKEAVRAIAGSLETQYERMMQHKATAILGLRQMTGISPSRSVSQHQ